uniref:Uncharacterized protein n=1 Tax=Zea mays TaxID=4577 RepID=A0A804LDD4_MAIZE
MSKSTATTQSLKSRGVWFPGRDNEILAPIFTPPSVAEVDVEANLPQQALKDVHVHAYTAEETKEAFYVARLFFLLPLSRVLYRLDRWSLGQVMEVGAVLSSTGLYLVT